MVGNKITLWYIMYSSVFYMSMFYKLLLYYYFPDEVILVSDDLTATTWEGDWYNETQFAKKIVYVIMIRTRRPLKLFIGPFGVKSLDALISILKLLILILRSSLTY